MTTIQDELNMVAEIRRRWNDARGCRNGACYTKCDEIVRQVGLPYYLVQDVRDYTGKILSSYRYRWSGTWDKGALYINETVAGNVQYRSMDLALDALERVLRNHI